MNAVSLKFFIIQPFFENFLISHKAKFKTYNENCHFDFECNRVSTELFCTNGTCKCQNETKWYSQNGKCQKCPFGWINRNKRCYLLIKNPLVIHQTLFCKNKGGYLLNLTNENEWNEIKLLNIEYFTQSSKIWVPLTF